jgi:ubiquinone/menaquinone biosynthesis C-methylase UbiE
MADPVDPEGNETAALHELVDFQGKDVLEIGCGDGRMVWRYAEKAASALGLDNVDSDIDLAAASTPDALRNKVRFRVADAVHADLGAGTVDVVVLGRSI